MAFLVCTLLAAFFSLLSSTASAFFSYSTAACISMATGTTGSVTMTLLRTLFGPTQIWSCLETVMSASMMDGLFNSVVYSYKYCMFVAKGKS